VCSYPWKDGYVEVTVGGVVSPVVALHYEDILPVPLVYQSPITPSLSPSTGGLVTLYGVNFGGNSEVLLTNSTGEHVLGAVSCNDTSLSVSVGCDVGCCCLSWAWSGVVV
jgi:hypothetical protein